MTSLYASEEMVRILTNSTRSKAQHIYTENESLEKFPYILHEVNKVIQSLEYFYSIQADIKFAVVASSAPYQIVPTIQNTFTVLIDSSAFEFLLNLCNRVQSLPTVANDLNTKEVICVKDYNGVFLLDIAKDFAFNTVDIKPYIGEGHSKLIYQAATTYILAHEVAHIAHGHSEFIGSDDFQLFRGGDEESLTMRALEYDADCSATSAVSFLFELYASQSVASDKLPIASSEDTYLADVRKQYTCGIFIALLYLDVMSSDFHPKSHPKTYVRFISTYEVLQKLLSRRDNKAEHIPEMIRQLIVEGFRRLSGSIETLGHPIASNIKIYGDDIATPTYEYSDLGVFAVKLENINPLLARWARIRPLLEKYKRGGVLAPAQVPAQ